MDTGAFAMFDALGIREIWRKHDAHLVLQKFEQIEARANAFANGQLGGEGHPNTQRSDNTIKRARISFVSDTVVVGFAMKEAQTPHFAVMMAARWAAEITRMAIGRHPAWTYRGVVTYGKFAISDRGTYFVGPAVVEAAECYEKAQAAVIWLTAKAKDALKGACWSDFAQNALTTSEVDVPLKGKDGSIATVRTYAASPFDWGTPPEQAAALVSALLETFDSPKPDVAVKKAYTAAFLSSALEQYSALYAATTVPP